KHETPVFSQYNGPDGVVYGPGHNGFTTSPDGKQDWIIYHTKVSAKDGWDRDVRVQPFTWDKDGLPDFGQPIPSSVPIPVPSGQLCQPDQIIVNDNDGRIKYTGSWIYQFPRADAYASDVHITKTDGDSLEFIFAGTGIDLIIETSFSPSQIDIYIDGT